MSDERLSRVLVLGTRPDRLNLGTVILNRLVEDGWTGLGYMCLDDDGVYRLPAADWEEYDAMICTLGYTRMVPFKNADEDDIHEVIRACLVLPLMAAKAYVQERQDRGGTMVFIGSYAHDHPLTYGAAYCAAKAGLAMAVRELAWELTDLAFYSHILHPYHVPATPMGSEVVWGLMEGRGMTREQAEEYQRKDLKMPAHLTPEVVAEVVSWLLREPAARWLAGTGLDLYGGTR